MSLILRLGLLLLVLAYDHKAGLTRDVTHIEADLLLSFAFRVVSPWLHAPPTVLKVCERCSFSLRLASTVLFSYIFRTNQPAPPPSTRCLVRVQPRLHAHSSHSRRVHLSPTSSAQLAAKSVSEVIFGFTGPLTRTAPDPLLPSLVFKL